MVTPMDDMSTTHMSASRPNHGANMDNTTVNMMLTYGVLCFGCSFEKTSGNIFARDMANNSRLDDRIKPFSPVSTPMVRAVTSRTSPTVPSNSWTAAAVPQLWFSATSPCHGLIMAVAVIIKAYNKAATSIENMMSVNAFLDEKLNSSAAWGMLSNPTKAHGAIATMDKMAANVVFSGGTSGCMFAMPVLGLAPTIMVMASTLKIMMEQKMNCMRPDNPVPLTLK